MIPAATARSAAVVLGELDPEGRADGECVLVDPEIADVMCHGLGILRATPNEKETAGPLHEKEGKVLTGHAPTSIMDPIGSYLTG